MSIKTIILSATFCIVPSAFAVSLPLVIDDFGGGPDTVSLISLAPPETATGSFAYAGAVGGWRDVFVQSTTRGIFATGVAFGASGYASFAGSGDGGIIYDGSPGLAGLPPTNPDSFTLGYNLFGSSPNPLVHIRAGADISGASVSVVLYQDAANYGGYQFGINAGSASDYTHPVGSPDFTVGTFDPTAPINAFAIYFNGSATPDVDMNVSLFEIEAGRQGVPEGGSSLAMLGLSTLMILAFNRRISLRAV